MMSSSEQGDFEPLKYAMLGEDFESPKTKLAKFQGIVDWKYLRPHWQSGVLYFVDPELDLTDVGNVFTENDAGKVEEWLKKGDLIQIGDLHAAQWEQKETEFEALVVSPFVLCRPICG
ncbi:MAG: DUF2288 family protein [Akkermansiaceae bacterium]